MTGKHGLYAIFSQQMVVPGAAGKWAEPFARLFDRLTRQLRSYPKEEEAVLAWFDRKNSDVLPFIPRLGKLRLDFLHNPVARLFFKLPIGDRGPTGETFSWQNSCEYVSGGDIFRVLHIPFQITIKKKITASPNLTAWCPPESSESPVRYSENWGLNLRVYPTGFVSILLHVSIASGNQLSVDTIIDWLRAIKNPAARNRENFQLSFIFRGDSFSDLQSLFDQIRNDLHCVLFPGIEKVSASPIRDMIRLKPLQTICSETLAKVSSETPVAPWSFIAEYFPEPTSVALDTLLAGVDHELASPAKDNYCTNKFYSLAPARGGAWNPIKLEGYRTPKTRKIGTPPKFTDVRSAWAGFETLRNRQRNLPKPPSTEDWGKGGWDEESYITLEQKHRYSTSLPRIAKRLHDEILKVVRGKSPLRLKEQEILGLITKDFNWHELRPPREGFESFGHYKGDVIIASTKSIVMASDHWATRKQLQLWFQWKLQGVAELAYLQIEAGSALEKDPRSHEAARLFSDALCLSKHLSPRYRRWYYRVSEAIRLQNMIERLNPEHSYRKSPALRLSSENPDLYPSSPHDIFLSYAREDEARAARLAEKLVLAGFSVWWDREISPGESFGQSIEDALANSLCVLVLWSKHSVTKRWVLAEAEEAANRGVLIPVKYEDVTIPLGFRPIQTQEMIEEYVTGEESKCIEALKGRIRLVLGDQIRE